MKTFLDLAATSLTAALLLSAAPGCIIQQQQDQDDSDVLLAQDAAALSTETGRSSGLGRLVLSPLQASDTQDADQAAGALETRPIAGFYPSGCVTATRDGLTVHLEFAECTGPFGLVRVSGGIDATFRLEEGVLRADLVDSGDLTVQGEPVDYNASTDITFGIDTVDFDWTASWNGVTEAGRSFRHDAALDLTADAFTGCVTMSGTASGAVEDRGLDSVIEGYSVCPGVCPSAGKITSTGKASGKTIVVEFDGTDVAKVTMPEGDVIEAPLVCDAAL